MAGICKCLNFYLKPNKTCFHSAVVFSWLLYKSLQPNHQFVAESTGIQLGTKRVSQVAAVNAKT